MTQLAHSQHYPDVGGLYFARHLTTAADSQAQWIAVQVDQNRANDLLILRCAQDQRRDWLLETEGFAHQPCLAPHDTGGATLLWNEVGAGGYGDAWTLQAVDLTADGPAGAPTPVATAQGLLLPPSAVELDGHIWAAWPARAGDSIRIHTARREDDCWTLLGPTSVDGLDAFRPSLAAGGGRLLLAWDQYRQGRYEVIVSEWLDDGWQQVAHLEPTAGQAYERWLSPRLVVAADGSAYVTWVVLRQVSDARGIFDHFPFAAVAEIDRDGPRLLHDDEPPGSDSLQAPLVADMREGLLAATNYIGYAGLRRNPFLTLAADGSLWCLWEVRREEERTKFYGHLVGRRRLASGWSDPIVLHTGGIDYAVAPYTSGDQVPIAYVDFPKHGRQVINGATLPLTSTEPHTIDAARWARWQPVRPQPPIKPQSTVTTLQGEYQLVWADTHCHSVFSPDAEGEPDELIHFGRDVAGLDVMAIIDNDCYPHKALTQAEWAIHQALSAHFTKDESFVVCPGWEYTYHRPDADPGFNHRWLIYPEPGGRLYRRIDPDASSDHDLMAQIADERIICTPHHCVWHLMDPSVDRNVEVTSSWRVCIEEVDFIRRQLQTGHRFGFVGASDSHRALPGLGGALTGLYVKKLTPDALYDAYRKRRTIATQGIRLLIDFHAEGEEGQVFIGEEGMAVAAPHLTAAVEAPHPIGSIDIVRDGEIVYSEQPGDASHRLEWIDQSATPGVHSYYLRVKLIGDPSYNIAPGENELHRAFTQEGRYPGNLARARGVFAWTSPIWLTCPDITD